MNTNGTPHAEDLTAYPISRYECFWNGIYNPFMEQDLHGLIYQDENTLLYHRLPFNVILGLHDGFYFYELTEHLQDSELKSSIRFGSKIELNRNGHPKALPDSFYRVRAYMNSHFPGHGPVIQEFLEGLTMNGLLVNEDTDDLGELDDVISSLNRQTNRARLESAAIPATHTKDPLKAI